MNMTSEIQSRNSSIDMEPLWSFQVDEKSVSMCHSKTQLHNHGGVHRSQKRALGSLKEELQTVVSLLV